MKTITVSAPGKLMLLGEHSVVYNHPCIVTAVDSRVSVSIQKISKLEIELNAPEVKIENYTRELNKPQKVNNLPRGAQFVEAVLQIIYKKYGVNSGVSISTKNGFSSKYGLGSSSAVSVCVAKGLSELFNLNLSNKELFEIAYQAVLDVQKVGSGFDIAAAIWGGTLYFQTGDRIIKPLQVKGIPLVVVFSGIKADTATIVKALAKKRNKNQNQIDQKFAQITQLVEEGKQAILDKNWPELGNIMNQNEKILQSLGVSTTKLNTLCSSSIKAGADGAKISGSGGGDCIIALVSNGQRHLVEQAVTVADGALVPVNTGAQGVKVDYKN
jgi:mevalonate kinase